MVRRGLSRSRVGSAKTRSFFRSRCSAAIPTVHRARFRSRSQLSPAQRRKAQRPVVVTGTIGDAALGVLLRRDPPLADWWRLGRDHQEDLKSRYRLPQPRNALIEPLRRCATAAMDISDGLVGDLAKLCRASGAAANVDVWRVPLPDAARSKGQRAVTDGDDPHRRR